MSFFVFVSVLALLLSEVSIPREKFAKLDNLAECDGDANDALFGAYQKQKPAEVMVADRAGA